MSRKKNRSTNAPHKPYLSTSPDIAEQLQQLAAANGTTVDNLVRETALDTEPLPDEVSEAQIKMPSPFEDKKDLSSSAVTSESKNPKKESTPNCKERTPVKPEEQELSGISATLSPMSPEDAAKDPVLAGVRQMEEEKQEERHTESQEQIEVAKKLGMWEEETEKMGDNAKSQDDSKLEKDSTDNNKENDKVPFDEEKLMGEETGEEKVSGPIIPPSDSDGFWSKFGKLMKKKFDVPLWCLIVIFIVSMFGLQYIQGLMLGFRLHLPQYEESTEQVVKPIINISIPAEDGSHTYHFEPDSLDEIKDDPGFLGVSCSDVKKDGKNHIIVKQVVDFSPASFVGLSEGDEIISIDGEIMDDFDDVKEYIGNKKAGDAITLQYISSEQPNVKKDITINLTTRNNFILE